MDVLLAVLAILAGILGGLWLSEATLGVGIIAGACLLGILARIVQAGKQQDRLANMLREIWKQMESR